jgi:hypothetical protein
MNKVAICMRGKCLDTELDSKVNVLRTTNYKLCIDSIFNNIVKINPNFEFSFYLHGWVSDLNFINEIVNDYKPIKYILEQQIDFLNDYINIDKHERILKERYKKIHFRELKTQKKDYTDIHFQKYFQNLFSYAYSISKAAELIHPYVEYKYIINLRYDLMINSPINLNTLNTTIFYTDDIRQKHSPLMYGDFIFITNNFNGRIMQNFYSFLKTNIFNNVEYLEWVIDIKQRYNGYSGWFDHSVYSNQMIYAYFITKNVTSYDNVKSFVDCILQRDTLKKEDIYK